MQYINESHKRAHQTLWLGGGISGLLTALSVPVGIIGGLPSAVVLTTLFGSGLIGMIIVATAGMKMASIEEEAKKAAHDALPDCPVCGQKYQPSVAADDATYLFPDRGDSNEQS